MVTMRKPDGMARICIDFKAINAVATPLPFYMPRVEEVLEQVGRSKVLSKLALTKGYYQVLCFLVTLKRPPLSVTRGSMSF